MDTNEFAEQTQGQSTPLVYRIPPPTLFDEDDPIIPAAAQLRDRIRAWRDVVAVVYPDERYAAECFHDCLDELVRRDEQALRLRAQLLDQVLCQPAEPGHDHYVMLKALKPHPGKELSYPLTWRNEMSHAARFPSLLEDPDDPIWVWLAKDLFAPVEDFANYCSVRFLDYEMLQAWTFLDSLLAAISGYTTARARDQIVHDRLTAQSLPLPSQPND
ncbi:MAG: hypothetical protein ACYCS4_07740 [Acidimicrobiales bacterium]